MENLKHIFIALTFISLSIQLTAQNADNKDVLRERIYMQTDKQVYLASELIWIKLITTTQDGTPLDFSRVGYVELLGTEKSSNMQAKIDISGGVGEGWLVLPATVLTGMYRMVAYTRHMRNEGNDVFFEKNIGIVNTFKNDSINLTDNEIAEKKEPVNNGFLLSTDKTGYTKRSLVKVLLNELPENISTLSISVTGEDKFSSSDGKNPNIHQWDNSTEKTLSPPFSGKFIPEYEGHIISGKLENLTNPANKDSRTVSYLSFPSNQPRIFPGKLDSESNIYFFTKRIAGLKEIALVTPDFFSEDKFRVNIQSPFSPHPERALPPLKISSTYLDELTKRNVMLQVMNSFANDSINQIATENAFYLLRPTESYTMDEFRRFTTMEEVIIEFVTGLRFRKINGKTKIQTFTEDYSAFNTDPPLVLLDGIPIYDHDIIFKYNPLLVKRIDVYLGGYVLGDITYAGIASFNTYNNDYPELSLGESSQIVDYEGTVAHRKFYSPSYLTEDEKQSRIPDYRHTLYWNPKLQTNGEREITVPFFTSDLEGSYQVTIEGLTKEGKIIYATSFFQVE